MNAHGIHDVRVLTNRDTAAVGSPIPSIDIIQFEHDPDAPYASTVNTEDGRSTWRRSSPRTTSS